MPDGTVLAIQTRNKASQNLDRWRRYEKNGFDSPCFRGPYDYHCPCYQRRAGQASSQAALPGSRLIGRRLGSGRCYKRAYSGDHHRKRHDATGPRVCRVASSTSTTAEGVLLLSTPPESLRVSLLKKVARFSFEGCSKKNRMGPAGCLSPAGPIVLCQDGEPWRAEPREAPLAAGCKLFYRRVLPDEVGYHDHNAKSTGRYCS